MKMPKRFLYAAVLPLCGFIGYSFFSYYAFADEAGELELNFWLVLEIVIVNFYCLIYLPLSFFLLKNVTLSKFLYVLYVLVSFVLNFLYLAFGLFNITQLYLRLSALINPFWAGLVLSLLFIVVPAFTFFKPNFVKREQKLEQ